MDHICRFKQTAIDNRASVKMESPLFEHKNTPHLQKFHQMGSEAVSQILALVNIISL